MAILPERHELGANTTAGLSPILDRFNNLHVLVVGDAMLDIWMHGDADRVGREAPVPVFDVHSEEPVPGGAANCAMNAASLGAHVQFMTLVGQDGAGRVLQQHLAAAGIDVTGVIEDSGCSTMTKRRLVTDSHVMARFDTGTKTSWSAIARKSLGRVVTVAAPKADLVIIAHYGGGALDDTFVKACGDIRKQLAGPVIIDGHDFGRWRSCHPTAMTPSIDEIDTLWPAFNAQMRVKGVLENNEELLRSSGSEVLLATVDAEGMVVLQDDTSPHQTQPANIAPSSTCGAGDTVTAAFALGLGAGASPKQAADVAQLAASLVIAQDGTATCSLAELCESLLAPEVIDASLLAERVASHRTAGRSIVLTNGCFGVLHLGHARYLAEARAGRHSHCGAQQRCQRCAFERPRPPHRCSRRTRWPIGRPPSRRLGDHL